MMPKEQSKAMCRHLMAIFGTNESCVTWGPNFQLMQVAPFALFAKLATRLIHCIVTLPWITLLALSLSIELVSSSARVTSVKFHKGVGQTDGHPDPKIGPQVYLCPIKTCHYIHSPMLFLIRSQTFKHYCYQYYFSSLSLSMLSWILLPLLILATTYRCHCC